LEGGGHHPVATSATLVDRHPDVTRNAPPAQITHGPRDRPRVALTFHGQGDAGVVGRLLDQLEQGGVHVTVLAVGTWLAASPDHARKVVAAGHELGNHTQHHADIKRMGAAEASRRSTTAPLRQRGLTPVTMTELMR
jgi:peptidoglycan/xylan/chitin deacetylase (PgdA/CDA1 family)